MTLVTFDGVAVWGRWEGGNSATPFVFALFEDDVELQRADAEYGAQSTGPFSARILIGPRLDPAKSYEVGVSRGQGPESFDSRVGVIVAAPVLSSLDYDGSQIHVVAEDPGDSARTLVLSLWAGEREIARVSGSATEATLSLDAPLDSGRDSSVRLHHETELSVGRMGERIALVVSAPEVTQTSYDGIEVRLGWSRPPGGVEATGARIVLSADGETVAEATASGYAASVAAPDLSASASSSVTVRGTRGSVVGPVSSAAAVISASASLDAVGHVSGGSDGDIVAAFTGGSGAGLERFSLELASDEVTLRTITVGDSGGVVPGPLDPARSYTLAVRALGDGRSGPLGAAAGVIVSTPSVNSITTSLGESESTVTVTLAAAEEPPAWVTKSRAVLYAGAEEVASAEAAESELRLTLADGVDPTGDYAVQLQALGDHGGALSGPLGPLVPTVVHVPRITEASWDGTQVHVGWRALPQAGLVGYTVALHSSDDSDTGASVTTGDTQASLDFDAPSAGVTYTVTVVAYTDASTGPAQADPPVVAMRPRPAAWFVSDPAEGARACLYRADPRGTLAPATGSLSFLLPSLFDGTPSSLASAEGFTLQASEDATLPYVLVVDGDRMGPSASDDARLGARRQFEQFLRSLDASADAEGQRVVKVGAVGMLRQVVARGVPMPLAETSFYAFGLDTERRAVDLAAGMRLRVDASAYQLVPPDVSVGATLSGYVPQGSVFYEIERGGPGSTGGARTGVDAFLSRMLGTEVAPASSPSTTEGVSEDAGLGGTIDLIQEGLRRPLLRLVYPSAFGPSNAKGTIGTEGQVALIAADTYAALDDATKTVAENGTLEGEGEGDGGGEESSAVATFFRGRAALIPEIPVTLNGQALHVPVGTTVRQLLERVHVVPLRPGPGETSPARAGISMTRALGGIVEVADDLADGQRFDGRSPVMLSRGSAAALEGELGEDRFDLPLLPGDVLTTRVSGE